MPDKVNQLPIILAASVLAAVAERGHPREPHAILDNPEKFAVAKILRFLQTQIWWLGVKTTANHRLSAAVIPMTDGAMIREVKPRIAQILRRSEHGVLRQPRIRRDCHVACLASDHGLEPSRRGT